jgi:hypothetical protein
MKSESIVEFVATKFNQVCPVFHHMAPEIPEEIILVKPL